MSEILKDRYGTKIGEVRTSVDGRKTEIYDRYGSKLGSYDGRNTYDRRGTKVGSGNLLTSLLSKF